MSLVLQSRGFFSPFHVQYGSDDQKTPNRRGEATYMSALQATIPTLRPAPDAFKARPFVNSTEETYLYLSI